MTFNVTIPNELAAELGADRSRQAFELMLAELYREDKIGKPRIRELLGFSSWYQIEAFMQRHRLNEHTAEDLAMDIEYLERRRSEERPQQLDR